MDCDACGGEAVAVQVPPAVRSATPEVDGAIAICTACLATGQAAAADATEPGVLADRVGALPADPTGAVAVAVAVDRCRSLAVNRGTIEALFGVVEAAGHDPLLALDRVAADSSLNPAADLDRRLSQLEGLAE
jgi:hypothetical protein